MQKLLPVALIASSALILGGCTKPGTPQSQTPSQMVNEASEFAKAVESGKPTLCVMTKDQDKMEYQIKGKKMHMVATTINTDESGKATTTVGHMINDEKYIYTWDDKTKQGAKMAIPTEEEAKQIADKAKQYESEMPDTPNLTSAEEYNAMKDDGYTISCQGSNVDDSTFTPPTDVKFIDPSELMKAIPSPDAMGNIDISKLEELSKQYGGITPEDQ